MNALAFPSVSELTIRLRARELSAEELLDFFLQRITEFNPLLNAYLTVPEEQARTKAREADAMFRTHQQPLPPLLGIPLAVKDLEWTAGIRTTGGSVVYEEFVPQEDSTIVERLTRAGAIILGKTHTPEFGSYGQTWNLLQDDCRTPWNPTCTAAGSSGGSAAAVAAGLAPIATGTDGAGSIRAPASFCGVFGFKPSLGIIPMHNGFLGLPLHTCVGPLSRTVRDAALFMNVAAGYDPRDPRSMRHPTPDFMENLEEPIAGLRIAWSPDLGFASIDPEVARITGAAAKLFENLGCTVAACCPSVEVDLFETADPVRNADKFAAWGHLLERDADRLTPYVRSVLERGREVTGAEYSNSLRALESLHARVTSFFEDFDLLLTPTTTVPAYPVRQPPRHIAGRAVPHYASTTLLTLLWNLTGQPAASIPCGFTGSGLPVGLQIIGRHGEDNTVLQASSAFERLQPWVDKTPGGF